MDVKFRANEQTVKLPPLKPFNGESEPVKKKGIGEKSVELWTDTLKVKAKTESYAGGLWRGIKYGTGAAAIITGVDWFRGSVYNIAKGQNTVGHMFSTPFVLVGKTLKKVGGDVASAMSKDGITFVQLAKRTIVDLPVMAAKRVYRSKNVSTAAKWLMPVIAGIILAGTTIRGALKGNEESAKIDHRYNVGHADK